MCDFSLQHAKSRPAVVADKLTTRDFGRGTIGFCSQDEANSVLDETSAVCVLPGTEIAFDEVPGLRYSGWAVFGENTTAPTEKVARFRQINKDETHMHHDALEFPDGNIVLLTKLSPNQTCTILQLPAAPKTEEEAKEQTRLEVVA